MNEISSNESITYINPIHTEIDENTSFTIEDLQRLN